MLHPVCQPKSQTLQIHTISIISTTKSGGLHHHTPVSPVDFESIVTLIGAGVGTVLHFFLVVLNNSRTIPDWSFHLIIAVLLTITATD